MIVDLQTRRLRTLEQLRAFVQGNEAVDFQPQERTQAYRFTAKVLGRFAYARLDKADKGRVLAFLVRATGFSRPQLERLVRQWRTTGQIRDRRGGPRGRPFVRKYTGADIRLLAEVDQAYGQMSGLATREVLRRQYEVYGDARFKRLSGLSNGHLYNLRKSTTYRTRRTAWNHTRPTRITLGLRQAPRPQGQPGHVRVDTVHQGDRDGIKGLYLVNLVDEVTQFELIGATPGISERFLIPLLKGLLQAFPFPILGFHADNGSEYINHRTAALLETLHVGRFTRCRPRHSNDNALVEGKNAHVIRKWLGHEHIPRHFAPQLNHFTQTTLSPFLNYHRPCLFACERQQDNGKIQRIYRASDVMTPYARLRTLPNAEQFLKPEQDFSTLDALAQAETDLQAAQRLQRELRTLFQKIRQHTRIAQKTG